MQQGFSPPNSLGQTVCYRSSHNQLGVPDGHVPKLLSHRSVSKKKRDFPKPGL